VSVLIAPSGKSPLQSGDAEQGVLGFRTAHRGRHGIANATSSSVVLESSKHCHDVTTLSLDSLVLPKGWKISSSGLDRPLRPGQRRVVKVTVQPPRNTSPQALDLPVAIVGTTGHPALGGPTPLPYQHAGLAVIGGVDLLTRLVVPGRPVPAFVLPGPPPPRVPPYPQQLPPRAPSALTLNCSLDRTGTTVTATGTLSPAQTGVDVTVTYPPIRDFGSVGDLRRVPWAGARIPRRWVAATSPASTTGSARSGRWTSGGHQLSTRWC
jgi:NPCBM-associated, NEW3 domain of alpha-galactosidase